MDFKEKTILITGASGNLGWALVERFAMTGATLLLPDRMRDRLLEKANHLGNEEIHIFENVDLTEKSSVQDFRRRVEKYFSHIDILINTVGGYQAGQLPHEIDMDVWETMFRVNALSTLYVCQEFVPMMVGQGRGKIINTASRSALEAGSKDLAYSVSKSAVVRITESMAKAYHGDGILVNCVLPGTLDTPENREAMPKADFSKWVQLEEIADLYLFLASDMAKVVNGAAIPAYG